MATPSKGPRQASQKKKGPVDGEVLLRLTVDGSRYDLVNGSWSFRDEDELYHLTGFGLPKIMAEIQSGNGSAALIGHAIFLARRGAGEQVSLDEAHEGVNYRSEVEIEFNPDPDGDDEDQAPQDPGSN